MDDAQKAAQCKMAVRHFHAGRTGEALQGCQQVLTVDPNYAPALHLAGCIAGKQRKPQRALQYLTRAVEIDDTRADYHHSLALTYHQLFQLPAAARHYQAALARRADFAPAYRGMGSLLVAAGRLGEATKHLQRAMELSPNHADSYLNLGNVLERQAKFSEAEQVYQRALRLQAGHEQTREALGDCLSRQGRCAEAVAYYEQAMSGSPAAGVYQFKSLMALPVIQESTARIEETRTNLAAGLDRLLEDPPRIATIDRLANVGSFRLAYDGLDDRPIQERLARLKSKMDPSLEFFADHCRTRPVLDGRRIRVGFVSNFFYGHTIAKLNTGLIEHLDRQQFESIVLTIPRPPDHWRQQVQDAADEFVVMPYDLAAARQVIAAQKLDVLFYTDIGMDGLTAHLAHARLAPVQCVTWGHPVTTGLRSVDYFISSRDLETDAGDDHYTEQLVRLDNLAVCYRPPPVPSQFKSREALGLSEEAHLYVCPQTLFKLHPEMDRLFGAILDQDPRGELVLIADRDGVWRDLLWERLREHIPRAVPRIRFLPRLGTDGFLSLLAQADVMLDPIHFGGGNTSLEAFAVGTPIITWPSEFLRGRITLALYRQMQIDDCIASDWNHYVQLAVRLATNRDQREQLRSRILAANEVLYNNQAGIRDLEQFLIDAVGSAGVAAPQPND